MSALDYYEHFLMFNDLILLFIFDFIGISKYSFHLYKYVYIYVPQPKNRKRTNVAASKKFPAINQSIRRSFVA